MTSALLFWLAALFGIGAVACAAISGLFRAPTFLSARNLYAVLAIVLLLGSVVLS